jgi:hypothetical protein
MKRILLVLAFVGLGCGSSDPGARSPASVPPNRCPFGEASYPNGERVCDHGRELECRERIKPNEPGWWPTGKDCKPGDPPATSS